jgi:hypothetical protein
MLLTLPLLQSEVRDLPRWAESLAAAQAAFPVHGNHGNHHAIMHAPRLVSWLFPEKTQGPKKKNKWISIYGVNTHYGSP